MPYSPTTWQDGVTDVNAVNLNKIESQLVKLSNPPRVRAYHSIAQAIPNNANTILAFDSERFDSDGMHHLVTNNGRITCVTAGLFVFTINLRWAANVTGTRITRLIHGTDGTIGAQGGPAAATSAKATQQSVSSPYQLAVGDFVYVEVYQDSGGSLDIDAGNGSPEFSAVWAADPV